VVYVDHSFYKCMQLRTWKNRRPLGCFNPSKSRFCAVCSGK